MNLSIKDMKNTKLEIDEFGNKFFILNYQLHREDGPAIEYADGSTEWYLYNQLHRKNGPAKEYINDTKEWWFHGQCHREDGPAIECSFYKEWWILGKRHREDGPAREYSNGERYYYLSGQQYSEEEYWRMVNLKALW